MTTTTNQAFSLRKLTWAGVEIRLGDTRILIDPLENIIPLEPVLGAPLWPGQPVDLTPGTHVLLTHMHPDHYDRELLSRLSPSSTVGVHAPHLAELDAAGLMAQTVGQQLGEPHTIGLFTVTPVVSLDWRGDDAKQVAWVVEGAGRRIIHCGDTMWHGNWWQIARDHGPFDVAFVPVNGVIARFEGYEATVPVTMTPEQGVEAAVALGAAAVCAIHYGQFHNPPLYVQQPDIEARFERAAAERGIPGLLVRDGDRVPVEATTR